MATAKIEREMAAAGKGCLGKAADDEPVFILRGQDIIAYELVRRWADIAERHGCGADKIKEARNLASAMYKWPTQKYPD
jgi:hypothetical protein